MRSAYLSLLFTLFVISSFAQVDLKERKATQASEPLTAAAGSITDKSQGMELLKRAEAEAAALDGEMRAWVLWQIGMAYQSLDREKALGLFESALTSMRGIEQNISAAKPKNDPMAWVTGRPTLPPALRLEADIGRSIALLEPKRTDHVVQQIDPRAQGAVLLAVLASQEKEKQFEQARETLNRITALDEMPYEHAMRLMEMIKPEQQGELTRLFLAALASYRDHAPHLQFRDEFPVMLARYWRRLPKEAARQAIDEVLKQAAGADDKGNYSVQSGKETISFGSLYEYRVSQIMPALRELDPAAARKYTEQNPALASATPSDTISLFSSTGAKFHPSGGYRSSMLSGIETPSAQQSAAKADRGHMDEAMSVAGGISDAELRAQTYEYIARTGAQKQAGVTTEAIENMLHAAEQLQPRYGFPYYGSAAEIYMQIDKVDDAKASIEAGLKLAGKLYAVDSDDDDPNTALKAFWPSTSAYCSLLRQAARVSHVWAISLLTNIKDPEIKVAAETALAAGWLNVPVGPSTIITTKRSSNSISLSGRE